MRALLIGILKLTIFRTLLSEWNISDFSGLLISSRFEHQSLIPILEAAKLSAPGFFSTILHENSNTQFTDSNGIQKITRKILSRDHQEYDHIRTIQIDYLQMKKIGLEIPESTRKDMEYYDNRLWLEVSSSSYQLSNKSTSRTPNRIDSSSSTYSRRRILAACTTSILGCIDCDITGTSCTTCNITYFLNSTANNCPTCAAGMNPNCQKCNSTDCQICSTAFLPIGPNCSCTNGRYLFNATTCRTCMTHCHKCADSVSCIECDPYFNLNGTSSCDPSIPGCSLFSSDGSACVQCQTNFIPDPSNSSQCVPCPSGQYWVSNYTCQPCNPSRCLTCISTPTTCTSCNSGYFLFTSSSYCIKTDCPTGTYYNVVADNCTNCDPACVDCVGGPADKACQVCGVGFARELQATTARCTRADLLCSTANMYRYITGVCSGLNEYAAPTSNYAAKMLNEFNLHIMIRPSTSSYIECVSGCGTCSPENNSLCLYCADGYAWVAIEDTMLCIQMPFTQGYYNGTNKFPPAAGLNCTYETMSANGTCYSCPDQFTWSPSRQCRPSCPTHQVFNYYSRACENADVSCTERDANYVCTACLDRMYLDAAITCRSCHHSCLTCMGPGEADCLLCAPGFQTVGALCQVRCNSSMYYDTVTSTCKNSSNVCGTSSQAVSTCTSCSDLSLPLNRTCGLQLCTAGQYWSGTSCTACDPSCWTCNGAGVNSCTACRLGFSFSGGACINISCTPGCTKCIGTTKDLCIEAADGLYLAHSNYLFPYEPRCPPQTYFNNITRACENCHTLCSACKGPTVYDCVWCTDGYFRFANYCTPMTFDITQPGIGYDHENQVPVTCSDYHPQCDRCNKKDGCTKCFNGFHTNSSGGCSPCSVNSRYCMQLWKGYSTACLNGYIHGSGTNCTRICPSNQYMNTAAQCGACNSPCERCSGGGSVCFKCWPGDILDPNKQTCVQYSRTDLGGYFNVATPTRCNGPACRTCSITSGTDCTSCIEGYYLTGSTCTRCSPECLTCSGAASNCTSCHMGYTYDGALGTCTAVCERYEYLDTTTNQCMLCPYPCRHCNPTNPTVCTMCPVRFYLASGTCKPCHERCGFCTSATVCTKCFRSFALQAGNCVKSCPSGSYLNYTTLGCHSCAKFCSECVGPTHFNCTSCKVGFSLSPLPLTRTDNTSVVSGNCIKICPSDKYLTEPLPNECRPCHAFCSSCSGPNWDNCLTCAAGRYNVGSTCYSCHPYCLSCNGPSPFNCQTCPSGTSLSSIGYCEVGGTCPTGQARNYTSNICSNCDATCATCQNLTSTDCLSCNVLRPLFISGNNTCQVACPSHTFYDNATSSCLTCDSTCFQCTGASSTQCSSCTGVGVYMQVNNSCLSGCVGATYPSNTTHCSNCHATCLTCNLSTSISCLTCPGTQNLQPDRSCNIGCPSSYFANASMVCNKCYLNCKECSGSLINQCTQCDTTNRTLRSDNVCIRVCPAGWFYMNTTDTCNPCHTTCATCLDAAQTSCVTCKATRSLYMLANSSCQVSCDMHKFYNATRQACYTCHLTCGECTGPATTECSSCFGSGEFIQLNRSCLVGCVNGTYKLNSTHCAICSPSCANCFGPSSSECLTCPDPKNLQPDKTCNYGCPSNYLANDERMCVTCHQNCKECSGFRINQCLSCNQDRKLTAAFECISICSEGFFYQYSSDTCARCDASCETCNAGSTQSCLTCFTGSVIQPVGGCAVGCPDGFFANQTSKSCQKCDGSCKTCNSSGKMNCRSCVAPMVLNTDFSCIDTCPIGYFPNIDRNCTLCHSSCKYCAGLTEFDCTTCYEPDFTRLTALSQCVNCVVNKNEDYNLLCSFIVGLTLKEQKTATSTNPAASTTLTVSFEGISKFISKLPLELISNSIDFSITGVKKTDYRFEYAIREGQLLIDLWFSVTSSTGIASIKPIKSVILRNANTGLPDLVFANRTASCSIDIAKAPDMDLISSFASAAQVTNNVPPIVTQLSSVGMLIISMGLGAPLMRFLRVFKLISRFRLINVHFGAYLELFLTLANSVFKFGGDEISSEAVILSPNSRGKLTKYKVTAVIAEVMSAQVGVYIIMVAARIYRHKIRRYAVNDSKLTKFDQLINFAAEFSRVIFMTLIGIDVFFYAMHCAVHMKWQDVTIKDFSTFASVWQSLVILIILPVDIILMIIENNNTNFDYLRKVFRARTMIMNKMVAEKQVLSAQEMQAALDFVAQDPDAELEEIKEIPSGEEEEDNKLEISIVEAVNGEKANINKIDIDKTDIDKTPITKKVTSGSGGGLLSPRTPDDMEMEINPGKNDPPPRSPSPVVKIVGKSAPPKRISLSLAKPPVRIPIQINAFDSKELDEKVKPASVLKSPPPKKGADEKNKKSTTSKKKKKIVKPIKIEKEKVMNPLTEQFFGNGIKLHKLRTSKIAKFYNTAALLKLFFFEPFYVTLQMVPSLQITGLLFVQTFFTIYAAYTGLRCQAFTSVFSFVAALTTEVAMFLFLIIGFTFHMGGGASRFDDKFRNFLQFTGIVAVAIAAIIGAVDLLVTLVRTACNYLANRKLKEYETSLRKQREEQGLVRHRVIGRDLPGAEPPVPPVDADMSSSVADIKANQVGQSAKPVLGKTRLAPGKRLSRPPLQPLARK